MTQVIQRGEKKQTLKMTEATLPSYLRSLLKTQQTSMFLSVLLLLLRGTSALLCCVYPGWI